MYSTVLIPQGYSLFLTSPPIVCTPTTTLTLHLMSLFQMMIRPKYVRLVLSSNTNIHHTVRPSTSFQLKTISSSIHCQDSLPGESVNKAGSPSSTLPPPAFNISSTNTQFTTSSPTKSDETNEVTNPQPISPASQTASSSSMDKCKSFDFVLVLSSH